MTPRYTSASNAAKSPMAARSVDFQDLCSLGMDRAMGIEKASLATVVRLNSCARDLYQNALWPAPVFGNLFAPAANALAFYLELQMHWLTMMMPHPHRSAESVLLVAAPGSTAANSVKHPPTTEVLEHSMDVALGVWNRPAVPSQAAPLKPTMEIALGRSLHS